MNTVGKCCYLCKDRYVGCHDRCKIYQQAKSAYEKEKENILKKKNTEAAYINFRAGSYRRATKSKVRSVARICNEK